jgi:hypothetical protein
VKLDQLQEVVRLADRRVAALRALRALNDINGGKEVSFPPGIFDLVDQEMAAKGLISLLVETIRDTEASLRALGVE